MQKNQPEKNTLHAKIDTRRKIYYIQPQLQNSSTDLENMDVNTSLLTNLTSCKVHPNLHLQI